jgi:hypothetical protein
MNLLLDKKIRTVRKELKLLKREEILNIDSIQIKEVDLKDVLLKYIEITGHAFMLSNEEIAREFCEDLFYEIDTTNRKAISIAKFYDKHSTFIDVGYGSIKGRESITANIVVDSIKNRLTHPQVI